MHPAPGTYGIYVFTYRLVLAYIPYEYIKYKKYIL